MLSTLICDPETAYRRAQELRGRRTVTIRSRGRTGAVSVGKYTRNGRYKIRNQKRQSTLYRAEGREAAAHHTAAMIDPDQNRSHDQRNHHRSPDDSPACCFFKEK